MTTKTISYTIEEIIILWGPFGWLMLKNCDGPMVYWISPEIYPTLEHLSKGDLVEITYQEESEQEERSLVGLSLITIG